MKRRIFVVGFIAILEKFAQAAGQAKKGEKVRDPVCGLMVEKDPELSAAYKGNTYYFCTKADRDEFKKNPGRYVK